jgi:hypothetical protein
MGGKERNCSWIECFTGILQIHSSHLDRTAAYNFVIPMPVKEILDLHRYPKSRRSLVMDPIVQLLSIGYKSST